MSLKLETDDLKEFRVKNTTPVKKLGSAISQHILSNKRVVLSAIGAGAVNQATKAVIVASQHLIANNITLWQRNAFHSNGAGKPGETPTDENNFDDNHTVIRMFLKADYGS
jgi:stage V sporulation protein SpoVS